MNRHYIWVKSKCIDYYRFMNKLNKTRLKIEEIKYENDTIYLKIENDNFGKLKKYIVSYKFEKVDDLGIYKLFGVFKKYKVMIICIIMGFLSFALFSNLIVEVNVIHESKEIRNLITDELKEAGIKKLCFKKSYDKLQEIKNNILEKHPDKLDWLEIEKNGMVYNIRVEERIITDTSKDNKKCDLIAEKDGTISSYKIYQGEAVVTINDYVREGDILISGIIMYNEEEKNRVCASGEVYANTWYTVNVSIPFEYPIYEKTGNKKFNIVFNNDGNKNKLFKDRFDFYESEYKTLLDVFDFQVLLESELETEKIVKKYSEEEALNIAVKKAQENLKLKLGDKAEIIDKKVLKKTINDSKIELEVFIIVNELISVEQEILEDIEGNE